MPPAIDPARLALLPDDLRALFDAQKVMLDAERRRAEHERAARLHVESELAASRETVERLELLVKEYERARFGRRSEKFDPDQLQLMLEDIEIAIAEVQEGEEVRSRRAGGAPSKRRTSRLARAFPAHLPRIETVIEPESLNARAAAARWPASARTAPAVLMSWRLNMRRRDSAPPLRLPEGMRRSGSGGGARPSDRSGHSDRGAAGAGRGRQVQRAPAALSPVPGFRPARDRARPGGAGRLDGNGRLPPRPACPGVWPK